MIKNIVFDLGNVIFSFDPKTFFSKYLNNEILSNELCNLILNHKTWKEYDLGLVSLEDVKKTYVSIKPEYKNEINEVLDKWTDILTPIDLMANKMKSLKSRGYKIYILSNLSFDAYHYIWKHYDFIHLNDGRVLSCEEHINKPDRRIYEILIERYNLIPDETIYLDDLINNVEMGNEVGLNSIHVKNIKYAINEIEEIIDVKKETVD